MGDIAISVQGLGKQYRIGARKEKYRTLRDSLAGALSGPARLLRRKWAGGGRGEKIWALKDVSFEVKRGEVLGIIGRNGAGKSTLLKILSRITEPTEGGADIYGRVGSLLEVGTGFHMELSGRENIYLNGAILGMRRGEIDRRFDEIVDFAEVEQFIDTPVKHYSSGMYLRLAFAVAAHMEPEILLVDEVLAVGDAAFQQKCLGKMKGIAEEGRTTLFVSHNLAAIRSLCTQCVVLDHGRLAFVGATSRALEAYSALYRTAPTGDGGREVEFSCLEVSGGSDPSGTLAPGQPFAIRCQLSLKSRLPHPQLYCIVRNAEGDTVAVALADSHPQLSALDPGTHRISVEFPGLWLRPGIYSANFRLQTNGLRSSRHRFGSESVTIDVLGDVSSDALHGLLAPSAQWSFERV